MNDERVVRPPREVVLLMRKVFKGPVEILAHTVDAADAGDAGDAGDGQILTSRQRRWAYEELSLTLARKKEYTDLSVALRNWVEQAGLPDDAVMAPGSAQTILELRRAIDKVIEKMESACRETERIIQSAQ